MEKIAPLASNCRVASTHDVVQNSECTYTFHNPYTSKKGIVVNLATFVGSIDELALQGDNNEGLFVRIVKQQIATKNNTVDGNGNEVTKKITKIGIGVEGGFQSEEDAFKTHTVYSVVFLKNSAFSQMPSIEVELPYTDDAKTSFPIQVTQSVESVINHAGLAVQQDLKVWELDSEPKPVSKYAKDLVVLDNGVQTSPNPADWKCEKSGDTENLWLNLSTGYIGGGRKNWDGSGGSNGALDYFLETGEKYPLVVKLGTITADHESADCYSYAKDEDGPVKIPNLPELLDKRGIKISGMQKTVKSTAELEVELNANYAFDAITESGENLVTVSGPGLQGLQNLGNSCYINSVVQMLFGGSIPELSSRYGVPSNLNVSSNPLLKLGPTEASKDLLCQTAKLSSALTSGSFAVPVSLLTETIDGISSSNNPKYRLPPRMFKHVVGQDHVDFRTGQQQDAAQFLQYLLEKVDEAEIAGSGIRLHNRVDSSGQVPTASNLFAFKTTSRLVCAEDNQVKYNENEPETILSLRVPMEKATEENVVNEMEPEEKRQKSEVSEEETEKSVPTVTLKACFDAWSDSHSIDGLRWPHLNNIISSATEQLRFSNYPRYLVVQIQRYQLGSDWIPRKLEVKIDVPDEIDLTHLKSLGPQDEDNIIPEESAKDEQPSQTVINENSLVQLMDMGFSMNGCKRALTVVGGNDVEAAMNWIFEHNNDPDFNDPLPETNDSAENLMNSVEENVHENVDENSVSTLVESLGCFNADQVRAALKECDGAADRAADWLFSHMDDLDGAIAMLNSEEAKVTQDSAAISTVPLEDGQGRYALTGLVSHIGKNTGSGHYVAHLKKDEKWVIFNDEKVALSAKPPIPHAYLYLFQRIDSVGSPNPAY